MKHEPINGLPARKRRVRRDATRRPVSRKPQANRKLSCHVARRENLFLSGNVSTQVDYARRKRQIDTQCKIYIQSGKAKVTFCLCYYLKLKMIRLMLIRNVNIIPYTV